MPNKSITYLNKNKSPNKPTTNADSINIEKLYTIDNSKLFFDLIIK